MRTLKKIGYKSSVSRSKTLLSEVNREKRLAFALAHKHWNHDHWRKVLFSDESIFTHQGRVLRESNEEFNLSCTPTTVKHSQGLMFWGCFSYHGLGPIVPLNGFVTGDIHAE